MRRGIPRMPSPATLSPSPALDSSSGSAPACPACPPPTPLIPLFAALAIIAIATPLLYAFFSKAPSLLSLLPLLRSPSSSGGLAAGSGPEDLHLALSSLSGYRSAQTASLSAKRTSFKHLAGRQRSLARELGYPERQERLRAAGEANAGFLEGLVGLGKRENGPRGRSWSRGKGGRGDQGRVHEMIKHFVRDWSTEGERERQALFTPVLGALDKLFPDAAARPTQRVLVPGCGLSRLAYEISAQGFAVDANDYSWFMHLASTLILSHTMAADEHALHPFIHSLSHHRSPASLLRPVSFPDVLPRKTDLTLHQGNFLTLFPERGTHDAVVTLFFIDTAHNLLDYLDQIFKSLKPGGWWINEGPLLWFGTPRMELTLEEVLEAARLTGFVLVEQSEVSSDYTGNLEGMFRYIYEAQFWVMQKPVDGAGVEGI